MVDFAKLNRRIKLIENSIDIVNDIIQLESDKLILKWLKELKSDLESIHQLI